MSVADAISFGGLIVLALIALLQWRQTQRLSARSDQIQERLAIVEEARRADEVEHQLRADVTAEFARLPVHQGAPQCHLVVRNRGPASARDVNFVLGPDAKDGPLLRDLPLPLDVLLSGSDFTARAVVFGETQPHVTAKLSWADGLGLHSIDLVLSVPG